MVDKAPRLRPRSVASFRPLRTLDRLSDAAERVRHWLLAVPSTAR